MYSRSRLLSWQPDYSLLSFAGQKQFKLLVRHLLDRFFNNEIVSADGETLPLIMTVAWEASAQGRDRQETERWWPPGSGVR